MTTASTTINMDKELLKEEQTKQNISFVLSIIEEETAKLGPRSKQKRLAILLKTYLPREPWNPRVVARIGAWIRCNFNKDWYDDTMNRRYGGHHTGKNLIEKLYYRFQYDGPPPATREQMLDYNGDSLRRKERAEKKAVVKEAEDKERARQKQIKDAAREKTEIERLGGGKKGTERFVQRAKEQKKAKREKEAALISGDAKKKLAFWEWRLSPEGKLYDIPMIPEKLTLIKRFADYYSSTTINVKEEYANDILHYLLDEGMGAIKIQFDRRSQGKVHYYGLAKLPRLGYHISMSPVSALLLEGERRDPTSISGTITGYRLLNGKYYICVDNGVRYDKYHRPANSQEISVWLNLPNKWEKCSELPDNIIGGKRYVAHPKTRVRMPFTLKILQPDAIESIEWVDNGKKFKVLVEKSGKNLEYIKSLRTKTQEEAERETLEQLELEAKRQKEERKQRAIAHQKEKQRAENIMLDFCGGDGSMLDRLRNRSTKPQYCPHCAAKVSVSNAKFCSSCRGKVV